MHLKCVHRAGLGVGAARRLPAARRGARPPSALVGRFRRSLRGQRPPTLARSLAQSSHSRVGERRRTQRDVSRSVVPFVPRVILLCSPLSVCRIINPGRGNLSRVLAIVVADPTAVGLSCRCRIRDNRIRATCCARSARHPRTTQPRLSSLSPPSPPPPRFASPSIGTNVRGLAPRRISREERRIVLARKTGEEVDRRRFVIPHRDPAASGFEFSRECNTDGNFTSIVSDKSNRSATRDYIRAVNCQRSPVNLSAVCNVRNSRRFVTADTSIVGTAAVATLFRTPGRTRLGFRPGIPFSRV